MNRRRAPGTVNLVAAAVVLAVILTLALRATANTTPAIAEFAPQAQQIKQAPAEQTSLLGKAPGGAATPGSAPSPSPSPLSLPPGAIVNNCIGDPPRQIEDPQSPPCVAYWQGNNGGSTWKGVNESTITIDMPDYGSPVYDPHGDALLQNFFNSRFEFYGRKLNILKPKTVGCGNTPSACRAQAIAADQQEHPFASMHSSDQDAYDYYDQLAQEQIISATGREVFSGATLAAHAPYMWQYEMGADDIMRNLGDWTCSQLAGHPASHAAGSDTSVPPRPLNTDTRVFGVITNTEDGDNPLRFGALYDSLAGCGVKVAYQADFPNSAGTSSQDATNTMVAMRQKGVTSVFCVCHIGVLDGMAVAANSQGYSPEWLLSSYELTDWDGEEHALDPGANGQLPQFFGLMAEPIEWFASEHMEYVAMKAANPSFQPSGEGATGLGQEAADEEYHSLLLIASGIQMAGPDLTPANFAGGLHRAIFPNPDTWQMEGHAGFENNSYAMTVDLAEFYWSPTARSPYPDEGAGAFCYVSRGQRFRLGGYPKEDRAFSGPCFDGSG